MDQENLEKMFPKHVLSQAENAPKDPDGFDLKKERRAHIVNVVMRIIKTIALVLVIAASLHYLIMNWASIDEEVAVVQSKIRNGELTNKIPRVKISIEKRESVMAPLTDTHNVVWKDYVNTVMGYQIKYPYLETEPPFELLTGQPQVVWFYYTIAPLRAKEQHIKGKIELRLYSAATCPQMQAEVSARPDAALVTLGGKEYTTAAGDVAPGGDVTTQFFYERSLPELGGACIAAIDFAELPQNTPSTGEIMKAHKRMIEEMMASFTTV